MAGKTLVAYYTHSGNTEKIAQQIARQTGGTLLRVLPEQAYPEEYDAVVEQAKKEILQGYRPKLLSQVGSLQEYDTVFVGSPNWWSTIAPPIATFLEGQDFTGKKVAPFCTHGGGGMAELERDTLALCPGCQPCAGFAIYGDGGDGAEEKVAAWLKNIGV